MTYGSDVFAMTFGDPEGRSDPMNVVFPKVMMVVILVMVVMTTTKTVMIIIIDQVTKCTFHKYGPSGTVTRHDGLCILALNIINEKVIIIIHIIFNHCCHNPGMTQPLVLTMINFVSDLCLPLVLVCYSRIYYSNTGRKTNIFYKSEIFSNCCGLRSPTEFQPV